MERRTATLLAVATATFAATFDGAAVQMALPVMRRELGAGIYAVQWVMTSFLLVSTAALLPAGRFGDVHGRHRAWRLGLIVFTLASAACAVLPGLWGLCIARAMQGAGSALIMANAAPLLVEAFPQARGRVLGLGNVAIALGLVAGPPFGALLTGVASWRLIFVVAVPLGLVTWLFSGRLLEPSPAAPERVDVVGGVFIALALGGLLVAGTFGRTWGGATPATLATAAAGLAALGAFVLWERRQRQPLLDLRLFGERMFLSGGLSSMLGFMALFSLSVAMPFFLIDAQARSLVHAGLLVGIVPVTLSLVAPAAGRLSDRIGSRLLCTAALAVVAAALALLSTVGARSGAAPLVLALGMTGAGLGAFEAPNDGEVLGWLPRERLGVGTATLGTLRNLGMTLGGALSATLVSTGMAAGSGSFAERATAGMHLAMIAGAIVAALGAAAAALRPGRRHGAAGRPVRPRPARRRAGWAPDTSGAS
jgi:EmrB/QacA subfamily drug resistance transporter